MGSRYKILPIPSFWGWAVKVFEQINDSRDLNVHGVPISPFFLKEGWYYDRYTNKS
jgi:hypothetical protein